MQAAITSGTGHLQTLANAILTSRWAGTAFQALSVLCAMCYVTSQAGSLQPAWHRYLPHLPLGVLKDVPQLQEFSLRKLEARTNIAAAALWACVDELQWCEQELRYVLCSMRHVLLALLLLSPYKLQGGQPGLCHLLPAQYM